MFHILTLSLFASTLLADMISPFPEAAPISVRTIRRRWQERKKNVSLLELRSSNIPVVKFNCIIEIAEVGYPHRQLEEKVTTTTNAVQFNSIASQIISIALCIYTTASSSVECTG